MKLEMLLLNVMIFLLKEYSELLKDINVSNKNVKVDYQEANTPIKLNTLHNLSLFIGNIVSDINKI